MSSFSHSNVSADWPETPEFLKASPLVHSKPVSDNIAEVCRGEIFACQGSAVVIAYLRL